jgi:hypothetical protein
MSTLAISSLLSCLPPIPGTQGGGNAYNVGGTSVDPQPDRTGLSPFADAMSTLQQLQQSAPDKYKQVTQQISTNLTNAAQQAQADGNTTAADRLNQLARDFSSASQSGQLPNVQDLASAMSHGGGHRHGHAHAASGSGSSSSSGSQILSQALAAYQNSGTQDDSLDPASIVMNTLSDAGTSGS